MLTPCCHRYKKLQRTLMPNVGIDAKSGVVEVEEQAGGIKRRTTSVAFIQSIMPNHAMLKKNILFLRTTTNVVNDQRSTA